MAQIPASLAADDGFAGIGRKGLNRKLREKSSWPAKRAGLFAVFGVLLRRP
jgi:hypothetical protein